jgi:hypothetical protein
MNDKPSGRYIMFVWQREGWTDLSEVWREALEGSILQDVCVKIHNSGCACVGRTTGTAENHQRQRLLGAHHGQLGDVHRRGIRLCWMRRCVFEQCAAYLVSKAEEDLALGHGACTQGYLT